MKIIQVGKNKPIQTYSYKDIKYDEDGWVDADKYLPLEFDIVFLRMDDKKIYIGWLNGKKWEGLKILGKKFKYWKRKIDDTVREINKD